jgi:hypothetical protein
MNLFSVAIGKKYEVEAKRLQESMKPLKIKIFTSADVKRKGEDNLINGLYHKSNFANYIDDNTKGAIVFMDADMFTLSDKPFKDFKIKDDTEFAYVPYIGKWFLPDEIRQKAFDYHGHKINSGFMYFKSLEVARKICNQWQYEYLEREKLYDVDKGTSKYEYDEWALMIALQKLPEIKIELLDSKWNDWTLNEKQEILDSDSIFFQSHNYLDIIQ